MKAQSDLLSWQISNPSNLQDHLPQPYRLIDQVLQQTIIYQLQLAMHHIQQKKKDQNYEGKVQEYVAQSLITIDHEICCLSSAPKYQNYLLAGDRKGNILVIDVAKKTLFAKKDLTPNKRINFITQTTISDGETFITICAAISNNSNVIKILRSKHNDPKIYLVCQVQVSVEENDIGKFPYQCKLQDDGRLLIVKTYEGSIVGYCLPQLRLDEEKIKTQQNLNQTLSNASNSIKKPTIYPLQSAVLDKNHGKITQKLFELKFQGYQKPLKYKDLLSRLKNKSKPPVQQPIETGKKDSKKDSKKVQVPVTQAPKQPQKQILHNEKQIKIEPLLWNNNDITDSYKNPKFEPFFYVLYEDVQFPKKKSFEKGKNVKMANQIIYGWTNTKQLYSVNLLTSGSPEFANIPYYQHFLFSQTLMTEQQISALEQSYKKSFSPSISTKSQHLQQKTIYAITTSAISLPEMTHIALGQQDGTVAVYDALYLTLQYNTDKHTSKVTRVQFFENGWKLISSSSNGEVFISNFLEQKCQVKRTQVFQALGQKEISDIKVNQDLGVAFVIDVRGNVRVYDLWRNQKISRFSPCNNFAMTEGKGKRWIPVQHFPSTSTMYTNKDYSVFLSIDWPHIPNSKAIQVPAQLTAKVQQLTSNPWKSKEIHLHVIRNFEFLLDHFDGLQSVYKKGYEKANIVNLFTNLEFTQLYDRNFDIPDFGRTVNLTGQGNTGATHKSNLSSGSKFSNSAKKPTSKEKGLSGNTSAKETPNQTRNVKLTTEVLHPEKFLFERRKINDPIKNLATTNGKLMEKIRQQHKKKERRSNILQDELNRTAGGI